MSFKQTVEEDGDALPVGFLQRVGNDVREDTTLGYGLSNCTVNLRLRNVVVRLILPAFGLGVRVLPPWG